MADKPKRNATLLGIEVDNNCPCGKEVQLYERQEIVWHENEKRWCRMCGDCILRNCRFAEPLPDDPGMGVAHSAIPVNPDSSRAPLTLC